MLCFVAVGISAVGLTTIAAMPERMWSLDEFRFDEAIEATEVLVFDGTDGAEPMSRAEAIALAHERGANLVAEWPSDPDLVPSCIVAKVSLPLRWERLPAQDSQAPVDERLWFEAPCGRRDVIVGNGHTYPGRMAAWCPHGGVGYNVSYGEMGAMSDESRYFVAGFLAGNEPSVCDDSEITEADMVAWQSARRRFRVTGSAEPRVRRPLWSVGRSMVALASTTVIDNRAEVDPGRLRGRLDDHSGHRRVGYADGQARQLRTAATAPEGHES